MLPGKLIGREAIGSTKLPAERIWITRSIAKVITLKAMKLRTWIITNPKNFFGACIGRHFIGSVTLRGATRKDQKAI